MSKEAFLQFLDRAAQDETLQRELAAIGTGTPVSIPAEALARFASERGFAVTADDVRAHGLELGDGELEQVAGGFAKGGPMHSPIFEKWISFTPLGAVLGDWKMR